jgi:hypothetical protein
VLGRMMFVPVDLGRFGTHGHQQLSLFNAHYNERCFLPIHVYERHE